MPSTAKALSWADSFICEWWIWWSNACTTDHFSGILIDVGIIGFVDEWLFWLNLIWITNIQDLVLFIHFFHWRILLARRPESTYKTRFWLRMIILSKPTFATTFLIVNRITGNWIRIAIDFIFIFLDLLPLISWADTDWRPLFGI